MNAKRRLQIVPQSNHGRPAPIDDDIFFHKAQLRVGSVLVYMGRTDPGSRWVITSIKSHFKTSATSKAPYRLRDVDSVRHLSDDIHIQRIGGDGSTRSCTFAYMSYSAIWRLG